mmetsp:Transcript_79469/g.176389  ORF Transcript_79469/g.176389 Transcript_79469/m.176389 type:complete len:106 (+) Transcript_79469:471-788(+)
MASKISGAHLAHRPPTETLAKADVATAEITTVRANAKLNSVKLKLNTCMSNAEVQRVAKPKRLAKARHCEIINQATGAAPVKEQQRDGHGIFICALRERMVGPEF